MLKVKWYIFSIKNKIKLFNLSRKKYWILTRTACLFNDTYKLLGLDEKNRYNIQKGRIDMWIELFEYKNEQIPISAISLIKRDDIKHLLLQQKFFSISLKNKPSLFIMDSFSELVDKKFSLKSNQKQSFYAYYSDVIENIEEFAINHDLLPIEILELQYEQFFSNFRMHFNCPIIFIFFPNKLETREKYITRSLIIKEAVNKISRNYNDFYCIDIPENIVKEDPNDPNIYHYSKEVYYYLAEEIKKLNLLPIQLF